MEGRNERISMYLNSMLLGCPQCWDLKGGLLHLLTMHWQSWSSDHTELQRNQDNEVPSFAWRKEPVSSTNG